MAGMSKRLMARERENVHYRSQQAIRYCSSTKGSNTRAGMGGRELPLHRSVARHRLGAFAFLKGNFPIHDVEPGINRGAETSGVDAAMTARLVA
jgi:hypothetical protein